MVAESEIVPSNVPSTLTLNTTVVDEAAAMVPPADAPAPVPSRTCTVREADKYSPWSSSVASVFVPTLAPLVTWIEPDTNVSPLGSTSVRTTLVPVSCPVFDTVTVYCRMSPGTTALPGWLFVSLTVVVDAEKSGLTVAIDVMNPPRLYESRWVVAVTVALVFPGLTSDVTFSTSMSRPLMLFTSPVVCGKVGRAHV